MKNLVATTFLVIMLTMSVLTGGLYLAADRYLFPSLTSLETSMAGAPPEARKEIMPHIARLLALRRPAGLYVPLFFFLTGVAATFILSLVIRGALVPNAPMDAERGEGEAPAGGKEAPKAPEVDPTEEGAARMLSILQNKGRLIDFLQEDIGPYPDAQIGAAVRRIHEDCAKALNEYVTLSQVIPEKEAEEVQISKGFDSSEIRLTGDITGAPPFRGTVQHPGWKITRIDLPERPRGQDHRVLAPAEIEIGRQAGDMG